MLKSFVFGLVSIAFICVSLAVPYIPGIEVHHFADSPEEAERIAPLEPLEYPGYDVLHYDLDISFHYPTQSLSGNVGIIVSALDGAESSFKFHLTPGLTVDSVLIDYVTTVYERYSDTIEVLLDHVPAVDETIRVNIIYHGETTIGYFCTANYSGDIIGFSQTEPEDSRGWFPCNVAPYDKATLDFRITVPGTLDVLSNGVCVDTIFYGDSTTYFWHHGYPIATYLINIVIGDLEIIQLDYEFPVYFYVYPEAVSIAMENWGYITDAMDVYSDLFGLYPFADEKYAMASVPLGWMAMEHQTSTTMGEGFLMMDYWYVSAHELAHHWFGDMVTCGTWKDIWLNESFAVYCECLYVEETEGYEAFREYVHGKQLDYVLSGEFNAFPIYDPDYMWGATVYPKGATVLDMLRYQIGDSIFFHVINTYLDRFEHRSAITDDLLAVFYEFCGDSLSWFFDQWIFDAHTPTVQVLSFIAGDDDSSRAIFLVHQDEPVYRMIFDAAYIYDSVWTKIPHTVLENDYPIAISAPAGADFYFNPDYRALCNREADFPIEANCSLIDSEVHISWSPAPEWANIECFDITRYSISDDAGEYVGRTYDSSFIDSSVLPGFYKYYIDGVLSTDTTYKCLYAYNPAVTVPAGGMELPYTGFMIRSIGDTSDYEIYYLAWNYEDYGFRVKIEPLSGEVELYSRADAIPLMEGDSVIVYDYVSSTLTADPVQIGYTPLSVPPIEQYHIYYFMVKALESSAAYIIRTEMIETGIEESFEKIPEQFAITAYPNPFNSGVRCQVSGVRCQEIIVIEIFDLRGNVVG